MLKYLHFWKEERDSSSGEIKSVLLLQFVVFHSITNITNYYIHDITSNKTEDAQVIFSKLIIGFYFSKFRLVDLIFYFSDNDIEQE